jgi:fatty acid/phospholipid biosynthesis enzyme
MLPAGVGSSRIWLDSAMAAYYRGENIGRVSLVVDHRAIFEQMKDRLKEFKKLLDPSEVGGVPFLGITKPVIKAHGSSNAWAIRNACRQARDFAQSTYISDVEANIEFMKVSGETENA